MKDNKQKQYLNNEEKINKMNNQNYIGFSNYSEVIIMQILNKIITNAFHIVREKEINDILNIYCNDFVMDKMNIVINTHFLKHDKDFEFNEEKINLYQKQDEQSLILPEPLNPEKDRSSSNMVKCIFMKSFSLISNINIRSNSQKQNLTQNRITEESNEQMANKIDKVENIKNAEDIIDESQKSLYKSKIIYSLPCVDLEEMKYSNIYMKQNNSLEFDKLRKEKELELKRKKADIKLIQKNISKEKEQKPVSNLKKQIKKIEYFDMNKVGFDSQGNIIKKNIFSPDSLSKDFSFLKLAVSKDVKKIKIKKHKNSEEKANNITTTNFRKMANDINSIHVNNRQIISGKNTKIKKVEYNPKDFIDLYHNTKYSKYKDMDRNAFFFNNSIHNLSPEPGVVFKSNIIKKIGGKNFYKKYNRPSMMEFNNFILNLSNSIPNTTHDMIKSTDFSNLGLNSKEKINETSELDKYNGYNENFGENNPLIKDANRMNSRGEERKKTLIQKNKYLKGIIKIKNLDRERDSNLSSNSIKSVKWRINSNSNSIRFSDNIQLSNNSNFDNLYNYLSERNNYKQFDFTSETTNEITKKYTNNSMKNILKNACKERLKYKKLFFPIIKDKNNEKSDINNNSELVNQMEKFNKNIINEVNFDIWGNYSEALKDKEDVGANNINTKPFSLFKKLNISKISCKRERKNIVDIIKKNNKLKFERCYNINNNKELLANN